MKKLPKILILLSSVFLTIGCSFDMTGRGNNSSKSTPSSSVEPASSSAEPEPSSSSQEPSSSSVAPSSSVEPSSSSVAPSSSVEPSSSSISVEPSSTSQPPISSSDPISSSEPSSSSQPSSSSSSIDTSNKDQIDDAFMNREYADINAYKSSQGLLTESEVIYSDVPGKEVEISSDNQKKVTANGFDLDSNVGKGYYTTYEKKSLSMKTSDIVSWGVDEAFFFPGNLVGIFNIDGDQRYESLPGVVPGQETLSISTYTATGTRDEGSISKVVETPTLSSTRQAISELVKANLVEGAKLPFQFASTTTQINSTNQIKMALCLSQNSTTNSQLASYVNGVGSNISADARTYYSNIASENRNKTEEQKHTMSAFLIELSQVYYTIDMDMPSLPSDLIAPSVSASTVERALNRGAIPAYVSSVCYGRKALIAITSNISSESFTKDIIKQSSTEFSNLTEAEALTLLRAFGAKGSVQLSFDGDSYSISQDSSGNSEYYMNASCFIYGGSYAEGQAAAQSSTPEGVLNSFTSSTSATDLIGKPLSYTLRFLDGSNAIANVGSFSEYVQKKLTPIEVENIYVDTSKYKTATLGKSLVLEADKSPTSAVLYPTIFKLKGVEGTNDTVQDIVLDDGLHHHTRIPGLADLNYINGEYVLSLEDITSEK